jgi:hypothetical protein
MFYGFTEEAVTPFFTKPLISGLVSSQLHLCSYRGLKLRLQSQVLSYGMMQNHYHSHT